MDDFHILYLYELNADIHDQEALKIKLRESYRCFLSFNALLIKNANAFINFPFLFNLFVNKHLKERLKDLINLSNSSTHYSSKCYQFDSW